MLARKVSSNYQRNFQNGNMLNKRGCSYLYHKPAKAAKSCANMNKSQKFHAKQLRQYSDFNAPVIPAGEMRATIPNVASNNNIFEQYFTRMHVIHNLMLHELKMKRIASAFPTNTERVEEVHTTIEKVSLSLFLRHLIHSSSSFYLLGQGVLHLVQRESLRDLLKAPKKRLSTNRFFEWMTGKVSLFFPWSQFVWMSFCLRREQEVF